MNELEGVWLVYGWDMNFYGVVPFADELEARRYADTMEGRRVKFIPFGHELDY